MDKMRESIIRLARYGKRQPFIRVGRFTTGGTLLLVQDAHGASVCVQLTGFERETLIAALSWEVPPDSQMSQRDYGVT